jgi:hypothetical protein
MKLLANTFYIYNLTCFLDVVEAYKTLDNEKKALEVAIGTLSGNESANQSTEASGSESEVIH